MASLNWVRVDASLASNHKTLALLGQKGGDRALNVFIFGLGLCALQGTDGFIPKAALGIIHGTAKVADQLVEVNMWVAVDGGWEINDYTEYQPSDEESKMRSARAKKAAAARWGVKNVDA